MTTVTQVFVLGRASDCYVTVDDEYASPHHAQVVILADGQAFIEDLGSTNGTYVRRGTRVWKVRMNIPIQPGDVLVIGRTRITWDPTKAVGAV